MIVLVVGVRVCLLLACAVGKVWQQGKVYPSIDVVQGEPGPWIGFAERRCLSGGRHGISEQYSVAYVVQTEHVAPDIVTRLGEGLATVFLATVVVVLVPSEPDRGVVQ